MAEPKLVQRLLSALPQTQCTRCGYPDCAAYAQAIATGEAAINQCPPGGAEGVARLAAITGQTLLPLSAEHGSEGERQMAFIDENWCIGCTLCLPACPVDAIVGSNKRMHTVIEAHCTGCELCLPVCPVDCIKLESATPGRTGWQAWSGAQADAARERYEIHSYNASKYAGIAAKKLEKEAQEVLQDPSAHSRITDTQVLDKKKALIEAAMARARAKRGQG
jgi:Na+-translocating ferredoxin:NAD+ oxidoreductase subunit B